MTSGNELEPAPTEVKPAEMAAAILSFLGGGAAIVLSALRLAGTLQAHSAFTVGFTRPAKSP